MTDVAAHADAEDLAAFEGRPAGAPVEAPDEVNQAMIRHWVEAMGDENPVYVDGEAARHYGFSGVVAPATMLQAWTMRGYRRTMGAERARRDGAQEDAPLDQLFRILDEAGFTSVVATDCEQEYVRPLVLGDQLRAASVIESVSPEKKTALGVGHFITTRTDFVDDSGAAVATMRFRILRFRPASRSAPAATPAPTPAPAAPAAPATDSEKQVAPRALRPRPAITKDNSFFFEGARQGKLLIQRCVSCEKLRHPPAPSCPGCRSFEWDTLESTGRGTLYSYVVVHHPQVPAFDYPLVVGLAELEEGTRLVADVVGVEPEDVHIGMAIVTEMVAMDDELTLPVFRPCLPEQAVS